jgi:hypothetical protein
MRLAVACDIFEKSLDLTKKLISCRTHGYTYYYNASGKRINREQYLVWKYNLGAHYATVHPGVAVPNAIAIMTATRKSNMYDPFPTMIDHEEKSLLWKSRTFSGRPKVALPGACNISSLFPYE